MFSEKCLNLVISCFAFQNKFLSKLLISKICFWRNVLEEKSASLKQKIEEAIWDDDVPAFGSCYSA